MLSGFSNISFIAQMSRLPSDSLKKVNRDPLGERVRSESMTALSVSWTCFVPSEFIPQISLFLMAICYEY
jgi:hypothetical protein